MNFKTQPNPHQLATLEWLMTRAFAAINSEPRTGKTWIAINWLSELWSVDDIDRALVVAPNGVQWNWLIRELPKHMPDWCTHTAKVWDTKKTKKSERGWQSFYDFDGLRIMLAHWEGLQSAKDLSRISDFVGSGCRCAIILDESHYMKSPSGSRAKVMKKFDADFKATMTGTPVLQSPWDVYAQYRWLDKDILPENFFKFKDTYTELLNQRHYLVKHARGRMPSSRQSMMIQIPKTDDIGRPIYKNLHDLRDRLAPHTWRTTRDEITDEIEPEDKEIFYHLSPSQMSIYKRCRDDLLLETERGALRPMEKLSSHIRLMQICSGFYHGDDGVIRLRENPKLALLRQRLASLGDEQAIIWYRFIHEGEDCAAACKKEGVSFSMMGHRQDAIDKFQAGKAQVIIASPQHGGTGLDLSAASRVFRYGHTFDYGQYLQSRDRAVSIFKRTPIAYETLIGVDTIEERVQTLLAAKAEVSSIILAGRVIV